MSLYACASFPSLAAETNTLVEPTENMTSEVDVILHVAEDGTILSISDARSGKSLEYKIRVSKTASDIPQVQGRLDMICADTNLKSDLTSQVATALSNKTAVIMPFSNHSMLPHMRVPSGTVYIFRPDEIPRAISDVPINHDYGSGITLSEVNPSAATFGLTDNYFTAVDGPGVHAFEDRHFIESIFSETSISRQYLNEPGLTTDSKILEQLVKYSSEFISSDPFLEPYRPNYKDYWKPVFRRGKNSGNFIGIFKSDWRTVPESVREEQKVVGHRYYIICKYSPSIAVCDQLIHIIGNNTHRQTWSDFAESDEVRRLEEMSKYARETLIRQFAEKMQTAIIDDNGPNFIHSLHNSIRLKETAHKNSADPSKQERVVCSNGIMDTLNLTTNRLLSEIHDTDGTRNVAWWFGSPNMCLGGGSWRTIKTASSFPASFSGPMSAPLLQDTLVTGYQPKWGFVLLTPVRMLQGSDELLAETSRSSN